MAGYTGTVPVQTTSLSVLDELYLHLDRKDEPWSVQLEVQVEGEVDAERLRGAIGEAAHRHPLARARLADTSAIDPRYEWEILDELEDVPLEVTRCAGDGELDAARERHLGESPPLDRPGPFAVLLAHHPKGDSLVLNLHHGAGDGLSAVRLMGSIARAYASEEDPIPPVDPLAARDVRPLAGQSLADRVTRGRAALEYLGRGTAPPARIAPRGGDERPGYGFELVELGPDEVETVRAHRHGGATVNDVLLAALAMTVREWNDRHGADTGAVYLTMPINLRPAEWRFDVLGNFASYVSVRLPAEDQTDLDRAVEATAASTRRIKDDGLAGLLVDLFEMPAALPAAVKQRLQDLIPLTGNLAVDTAVLSNLGRLEGVPTLGDAGAVKAVWFSPPGRMPLGASLGVATHGERLFATLRYRHALFDAAAAGEFAALYRRTLAS